jgi:UDP-N-acetylglucosamine--N-acetylmuramyl-(pentapeptide) pyrophosphoryl-undecaprenol N-acetylglucosamine transferase
MKLLIVGGHLTPALGLITHLPKDIEILYVGRKHALEGDTALSLEYQVMMKQNITFIDIAAARLQRVFTKHTFSSLLKLPFSFKQAAHIISYHKPDVIVGFGGYVSVPLCLIGVLFRIPFVIHEQTLGAGLANKILAPFASKICISWNSSKHFFPASKTVLTGNPALGEIKEEKKKKHTLPVIAVIGGSLGSHTINVLIEETLEKLLEHFILIHQTGDARQFADFERLSKRKKLLPEKIQQRYTIVKFVDPQDFISFLSKADLIVSRAGINTVSTLLILQKVALLIPLPFEQEKNAQFFKDHGLGEVVREKKLTGKHLFQMIYAMIKNIHQYRVVQHAYELEIHKNAAKNMLDVLLCVKNYPQRQEEN